MKKHRVGETKPDINKDQALFLHGVSGICLNPYLVSKPLSRTEHTTLFSKRFYSKKCWQCLNCKWEGEEMKTRTV